MKKLFTLIVASILLSSLLAQSPEKMSYQAIIRNSNDQLVTNQQVGIRISILKGSAGGTAVYTETQTPTTNADGLLTIEVGAGTTSDDFSAIHWENSTYFIKTETDPASGTNYTIVGTSQMLSVPYALYAKTAGNGFNGIYTDLTGKPDFSTWDKDTTDDVTISGTQTIEGKKIFSDTIIANYGVNVNNKSITNLADPVNAKDLATKAYVDAVANQLYEQGKLKVKDADGNLYNTIKIGSQVWMTENLKTTMYNDGSPIPLAMSDSAWSNTTIGARCYSSNDSITYKNNYGALYNWYTVNTGKLCPAGWHVPSDSEWTIVTNYLGGSGVAGGKLKETGTTHWLSPNTGATNESGFNALPGGYRYYDGRWMTYVGRLGFWWSSSTFENNGIHYVFFIKIENDSSNVTSDYDPGKNRGLSVRCLKN